MLEPLSVAVHAVAKVGDLHSNNNVAVFGCVLRRAKYIQHTDLVCRAGPVGLLCMAVAKALGSKRILAIDVVQEKLDFAKQYAATDIWKSTPPKQGESMSDYARRQAVEIRDGTGIDLGSGANAFQLVVDCTGAEPCIATAIYLTGDGCTMVQVGIRAMNASIP